MRARLASFCRILIIKHQADKPLSIGLKALFRGWRSLNEMRFSRGRKLLPGNADRVIESSHNRGVVPWRYRCRNPRFQIISRRQASDGWPEPWKQSYGKSDFLLVFERLTAYSKTSTSEERKSDRFPFLLDKVETQLVLSLPSAGGVK